MSTVLTQRYHDGAVTEEQILEAAKELLGSLSDEEAREVIIQQAREWLNEGGKGADERGSFGELMAHLDEMDPEKREGGDE